MKTETVKIEQTASGIIPQPSELSDHQLWGLVLTPIEDRMPSWIKEYIQAATAEFSKREVKLVPICK